MSWKVLIVDGDEGIHRVSKLSIKRLRYKEQDIVLFHAYNQQEAKTILEEQDDMALVLLDLVIGDDHRVIDLVSFIRNQMNNHFIQIIIRTSNPGHAPVEQMIIDYDVNDYQEKTDLTNQKLRTSIITAIRAYDSIRTIETLNREIGLSKYDLFFTLGQIAETRSKETGNHVKRVGEISKLLALKCGYTKKESELLKMAASMHDVGKMAIPDTILNKPGKLTVEEFDAMKTHSTIGYEMLKSSEKPILDYAATIAKEHHENFDGTGYPDGLKGDEIQKYSRIVSVADVFDALGNKRAYKDPWPMDKIISYMKEQSGIKFDPEIMTVFFEHIDEVTHIRNQFPDM